MNNELFLELTKDLSNLDYKTNVDGLRSFVLQRSKTLISVLDEQIIQGYIYKMNNSTITDLLKVAVNVDVTLYDFEYDFETDNKYDILPILIIDKSNAQFIDDILNHNNQVESSDSFNGFTIIQFSTCFYPIIIAYNEGSLSEILDRIGEKIGIAPEDTNLLLFIDTLTSSMYSEIKNLYIENDVTVVSMNNKVDIEYDVKAPLLGYEFEIRER